MSVINQPKKCENPSLSIFRFSWNCMSRRCLTPKWEDTRKIRRDSWTPNKLARKKSLWRLQTAPILWCEFRTLDMWSQKPEQRFWRALRGCFVAAQLHKALFTAALPWCFIWVDIFKDSQYPSRGRTLCGLIVIQEGNKVLRISPSLG